MRKARRILNKLLGNGTLFAFVEMGQEHGGASHSTNNAVESVNARLRNVLAPPPRPSFAPSGQGDFLVVLRRTENPLPAAEILRVMPTDDDVDGLYASVLKRSKRQDGAPEEYGAGIVWEEFHMPTKLQAVNNPRGHTFET